MTTYLIGIGGMIFMVVLWAVVQGAWRKTFADYISDDDVLAGRTSCSNCGCTTICERKNRPLSGDHIH